MTNVIEKKAHDIGVQAKGLLTKGASNLEEQAYKIGAKAKELAHQGEEKVKDGVHYLEEEIKARPFVAAGAALMVGFLIGRLLRK